MQFMKLKIISFWLIPFLGEELHTQTGPRPVYTFAVDVFRLLPTTFPPE